MDIDCIFKNTSVVSMNRKQCPLVLLHPTYFMYLLPKSIALEKAPQNGNYLIHTLSFKNAPIVPLSIFSV